MRFFRSNGPDNGSARSLAVTTVVALASIVAVVLGLFGPPDPGHITADNLQQAGWSKTTDVVTGKEALRDLEAVSSIEQIDRAGLRAARVPSKLQAWIPPGKSIQTFVAYTHDDQLVLVTCYLGDHQRVLFFAPRGGTAEQLTRLTGSSGIALREAFGTIQPGKNIELKPPSWPLHLIGLVGTAGSG